MCGRFAFNGEQWPESVAPQFPEIEPNYNISPQDNVNCIWVENNIHKITPMKWGFRPSWSKTNTIEPINARLDSISEKPIFRDSFEKRRCLIPATGWYEWKTTPSGKIPFYHRLVDNQLMLFAGIFDDWNDSNDSKRSFCILTTDSHQSISHIHLRMPLIVPHSSIDEWLNFGTMKSNHESLEVYPVDRKVNSTTAKGPELTYPIPTLFD
jgi:putative SOS response-associated peptidase YedK